MSVMGEMIQNRKEVKARIEGAGKSEYDRPINLKPWRDWRDGRMQETVKQTPIYFASLSAGLAISPNSCVLVPRRTRNDLTRRQQLQQIVKIVCEGDGVKAADILSARRWGELLSSRHLVMYLACELTTLSLNEIGGYMSGRHHTTIMHGRNTVSEKIKTDLALKGKVDAYRAAMAQYISAVSINVDVALSTGWAVNITQNVNNHQTGLTPEPNAAMATVQDG